MAHFIGVQFYLWKKGHSIMQIPDGWNKPGCREFRARRAYRDAAAQAGEIGS